MTEEFIFFEWGEGVTNILGWKLDEVRSSFSNVVISFSIEDISFLNNEVSFLNEEISLEVSESNEKHDSRSENSIAFEFSSWTWNSDEDSESRFQTFLVDEKDESSELVSLMFLKNENHRKSSKFQMNSFSKTNEDLD